MSLDVHSIAEQVLSPGRLFAAPPRRLRIEHVASERLGWELFRGHLLDPANARQQFCFAAWNVYLDAASATAPSPLLSLKWRADSATFHVTRSILTHGFEAYEESPSVFVTRAAQKWATELVGTVDMHQVPADALIGELSTYVSMAVVGTSRLPIVSLESPLPAYSLGQLWYLGSLPVGQKPWTDSIALLAAVLANTSEPLAAAKALETALRAIDEHDVPRVAGILFDRAQAGSTSADGLSALFRTMFNHVALSPYTQFAPRMIQLLQTLAVDERVGSELVLDIVSYMLRHVVRHLTAFDLTLFHNFGANYPDALFLDALLTTYLRLIEDHGSDVLRTEDDSQRISARKRMRRRALRSACLVRQQYQGHRVPDAPTSMGENQRVLPAPYARVPEEQITNQARRMRELFAGNPIDPSIRGNAALALQQAIDDLGHDLELRELGMATFLDRPLGILKEPGEVDRTPLVAYEAFSRDAARRRLEQLKSVGWLSSSVADAIGTKLESLLVAGVPTASLALAERPGVVSLADANKAGRDFVALRSTRRSLDDLLSGYDLRPLAHFSKQVAEWLSTDERVLLVQHLPPAWPPARSQVHAYDRQSRLRLAIGLVPRDGQESHYTERGGIEQLESLQVLRVCEISDEDRLIERDLVGRNIMLKRVNR